jgi:hypothetical protein
MDNFRHSAKNIAINKAKGSYTHGDENKTPRQLTKTRSILTQEGPYSFAMRRGVGFFACGNDAMMRILRCCHGARLPLKASERETGVWAAIAPPLDFQPIAG